MTVNEADTLLSQLVGDPNGEVFSQATYRLPALNSAQRELVLTLLGFRNRDGVHDLLSEIQEVESISVDTSGYTLSGLTQRTFLRNGYVNSKIVDDDGADRWLGDPIPLRKLGTTENQFLRGTTRSPKCYMSGGKYYLLIDVGGYPRSVEMHYIGQPVTLSAGGSFELNPLLHDLIVFMAERLLRRERGGQSDQPVIQFLSGFISQQIQLISTGESDYPNQNTIGQFMRKNQEFLEERRSTQ